MARTSINRRNGLMTFSIKQFKAELQSNGYLRPWEYQVVMSTPPGLNAAHFVQQNQTIDAGAIQSMITMRATQARTPSAQLDWLDIPRYGIGLKQGAPYNAHVKHSHFAIICDKYGNIYNYFHAWLNYVFAFSPLTNSQGGTVINQSRANYLANYKDQYSTNVFINLFDLKGHLAMQFELFQAFPVTIMEVPLDWDETKALVELTIVLDYRDYTVVTSNLGNGELNTTLTSPPSSTIPARSLLVNA
jgi:hypothetical protein